MITLTPDDIWNKYGLSSCIITGQTIAKEYYHSAFAAKMSHTFLAEQPLLAKSMVLYHPNYYIGYLCAHIRETDTFYLIGPYRRVAFDNETISFYYYASQLHIPQKDRENFLLFMSQLPLYYELSAKQLLLTVCGTLTGREQDADQIQIREPLFPTYTGNPPRFVQDSELSPPLDLSEHFLQEEIILSFITNGDANGYVDYVSSNSFIIHAGVLDDQYRNIYHIAITAMVLASRAAIRGGLNYSISQNMLDNYLARLEKLKTTDEFLSYIYSIYQEYAQAVYENRIRTDVSPTLRKVLNYIQSHLDRRLSLEELAKQANISRTYLSKLFTKEMHMSLPDYLAKQRTAAAKHLLRTSDLPLITISEKLGYSSQAYFQNVFKKQTGMTPQEFRNSAHR